MRSHETSSTDTTSDDAQRDRQISELRVKVREAEISLAAGLGRPLDVDALIIRVRKRLAEAGITN
jgi:hypothetical protein